MTPLIWSLAPSAPVMTSEDDIAPLTEGSMPPNVTENGLVGVTDSDICNGSGVPNPSKATVGGAGGSNMVWGLMVGSGIEVG